VSKPLVSVLLPAYNAQAYIESAVNSIRNQTFRDFELIIIDDGSRDGTLVRIEALAAEDDRIRVVSRENRGLIKTLNEAISLAQGDLIARMDADDIAYPERLERQVAAFKSNPGLCLCGTGIDTLNRGRIFSGKPHSILTEGSARVLSIFYTILLHPTFMIDRRVAGGELYYDEAYPHAEDFDLIRRLASRSPILFLPEPLLAYRQHENSVTMKHRTTMRQTHMRIVAENLRADGFEGNIDALQAFATQITSETAGCLAHLMVDIQRQFSARDPDLLASYQFGWEALFYLLHTMFVDARETGLLCQFMSETNTWHLIRRREQLVLRLSGHVPALAVAGLKSSYALYDLVCLLDSKPVGAVRPLLEKAAK
jgi:glycosyltransferase involved in cell wall biosynthesis